MHRLFLLMATFSCVLGAPVAANEPINVGGRKQLFIDQRFIDSSHRIELRTNPAQKLGRIRDPDGKLARILERGRRMDLERIEHN